jgi:CHAT domain-containing protein
MLEVYYDQATPAQADWHNLHRPSLEAARAFLLVCTPGIFSKLGPKDWVHMELEWWLEHRDTAPILIDPLGQGDRWLPQSVRTRYPNAQRIQLNLRTLQQLPEKDRLTQSELIIERITGGINASEAQTGFEDLKKQKVLVKKLRRSLGVAIVAILLTIIAAALSVWFSRLAEQEANRNVALNLLRQAEDAIVTHDNDKAKVISAQALTYDHSSEVFDRFAAMSYKFSENNRKAFEHLKNVLKSDYQHLIEQSSLPLRVEHYSRELAVESALDTWLTITQKTEFNGYDMVLRFKGLTSRMERAAHQKLRAKPDLLSALSRSEAELSWLAHQNWRTDKEPKDEQRKERGRRQLDSGERLLKINSLIPWGYYDLPSLPEEELNIIQDHLRDGEALVDFIRYKGGYIAWVVHRTGKPVRVELGSVEQIEKLAAEFRYWVEDRTKRNIPGSVRQFYEVVWRPIEVLLGRDIKVVYLVPDAKLARIPFAAIPTGDNHFLMHDMAPVYLTTALDLIPSPARTKVGRGLLAVGSPEVVRGFPPLPYVREEIKAVASLFENSDEGENHRYLLFGELATEEAFRRSISGRRIVHFAGHGITDVHLEDSSNPILEGAQSSKEVVASYLVSLDPSLRSVLILGATDLMDGQADGILAANEVSALDLDGVELVVLSAAETASHANVRDALMGLVGAFRIAGARTIVASLFFVDDEATRNLMIDFYAFNRQTKDSYPEALRKAMLKMTADPAHNHPSYWAPFVVYGNIRD